MDLLDFDDPDYDPDLMDMKLWAQVPQPIRKIVEQHVAARLPAKILAKLRDLHAREMPISYDDAFFHFGGGMSVRNLCRQRLGDRELAALPVRRGLGQLLRRGSRRDRCDAAVRQRAPLSCRTGPFSATPSVLCSAAKVHPLGSRAARASGVGLSRPPKAIPPKSLRIRILWAFTADSELAKCFPRGV
jgi:hypothetical protein